MSGQGYLSFFWNMEKHIIRQQMKQRIQSLDPEVKRDLDYSILHHVISHPRFKEANNILIFLYQGEIDTNLFIPEFMGLGKSVVTVARSPGCKGRNFYQIMDFFNDLYFNEDKTKLKSFNHEFNPDEIDLLLGCCLAFTADGHHIGYGKGDFDKFFSDREGLLKKLMLLAYSFQEVEARMEEHDIRVPAVITEKGYREFT